MYVGVCLQKGGSDRLELGLQIVCNLPKVRVLGVELNSYGRAASSLNLTSDA